MTVHEDQAASASLEQVLRRLEQEFGDEPAGRVRLVFCSCAENLDVPSAGARPELVYRLAAQRLRAPG